MYMQDFCSLWYKIVSFSVFVKPFAWLLLLANCFVSLSQLFNSNRLIYKEINTENES